MHFMIIFLYFIKAYVEKVYFMFHLLVLLLFILSISLCRCTFTQHKTIVLYEFLYMVWLM